jgi:hypothetical protein
LAWGRQKLMNEVSLQRGELTFKGASEIKWVWIWLDPHSFIQLSTFRYTLVHYFTLLTRYFSLVTFLSLV